MRKFNVAMGWEDPGMVGDVLSAAPMLGYVPKIVGAMTSLTRAGKAEQAAQEAATAAKAQDVAVGRVQALPGQMEPTVSPGVAYTPAEVEQLKGAQGIRDALAARGPGEILSYRGGELTVNVDTLLNTLHDPAIMGKFQPAEQAALQTMLADLATTPPRPAPASSPD